MKKGEMPAESLAERDLFLSRLARSGWNVESWDEMLDAGHDVEPEATAGFAGPVFDMTLEYHADEGFLLFELVERDGDQVIRLRIYPRGNVDSILDRIVQAQPTLDGENHPDLVKALILLADPLLIETDEGLFRLS